MACVMAPARAAPTAPAPWQNRLQTRGDVLGCRVRTVGRHGDQRVICQLNPPRCGRDGSGGALRPEEWSRSGSSLMEIKNYLCLTVNGVEVAT